MAARITGALVFLLLLGPPPKSLLFSAPVELLAKLDEDEQQAAALREQLKDALAEALL